MPQSLRHFFATALFLLVFGYSFSQNEESSESPKKKWTEKVFFGGNLGGWFGTITYIDISPLVGYRFSEKFNAGIGATYLYYSDSDINYSTHIYGGRAFGRYFIIENLFAHAEYEILNGEWLVGQRSDLHSVFVGGGYSQRIGRNSFFNLTVLWNLNDSSLSPYRNPIFRMGFGIGI